MTDKAKFTSARELAGRIAAGEVGIRDGIEASTAAILSREADVRAFQFLDWQNVERQVERLHDMPADRRGPLYGVPVAVKDVFDTADMPTGYGSQIYTGHQPAADAACVARLRAAGAIIIGKTVTTEFAYWHAGPTRNPHDTRHTPGGSSSGSCAGLAAGMFPLALGTQTAASTIRPAAYCGITGYKPSRQWISRVGVKALAANSLDAVGVFARSVDDAVFLAEVLAGVPLASGPDAAPKPPSVALWQGREWHAAEPAATDAVAQAVERLAAAGAAVSTVRPAPDFARLIDLQKLVMMREAATDLAYELIVHRNLLSDVLAAFLDQGAAVAAESYNSALAAAADCRRRVDELFAGADILAAPSAPGEAPLADVGTGSPDLSRAWTLLDLPSLTIPCGVGPSGLPLGLQLAARPGQEAALIRAGRWVERQLAPVQP